MTLEPDAETPAGAGARGADGEPSGASREVDPDLVNGNVLGSAQDAPWALVADAALVVFATELAVSYRPAWGLGVLAGAVLIVGMQLARYRYRVVAAAAQVKLAAGLVIMGASVALFVRPPPWLSVSVLGAAGAAKFARELARYLSLKRRTVELGLRRRRNPKTAAVSGAIFILTAFLAYKGVVMAGGGMRVAFVAWLAGYSLVSVIMELWA